MVDSKTDSMWLAASETHLGCHEKLTQVVSVVIYGLGIILGVLDLYFMVPWPRTGGGWGRREGRWGRRGWGCCAGLWVGVVGPPWGPRSHKAMGPMISIVLLFDFLKDHWSTLININPYVCIYIYVIRIFKNDTNRKTNRQSQNWQSWCAKP